MHCQGQRANGLQVPAWPILPAALWTARQPFRRHWKFTGGVKFTGWCVVHNAERSIYWSVIGMVRFQSALALRLVDCSKTGRHADPRSFLGLEKATPKRNGDLPWRKCACRLCVGALWY